MGSFLCNLSVVFINVHCSAWTNNIFIFTLILPFSNLWYWKYFDWKALEDRSLFLACLLLCRRKGWLCRWHSGMAYQLFGLLLRSGQFCCQVHLGTCSAATVAMQPSPPKYICLQFVLLFASDTKTARVSRRFKAFCPKMYSFNSLLQWLQMHDCKQSKVFDIGVNIYGLIICLSFKHLCW